MMPEMVPVTVDWSAAKVPEIVPKVEAVEVIVASGMVGDYSVTLSMTLTRKISVREMVSPGKTNLMSQRAVPMAQLLVSPE